MSVRFSSSGSKKKRQKKNGGSGLPLWPTSCTSAGSPSLHSLATVRRARRASAVGLDRALRSTCRRGRPRKSCAASAGLSSWPTSCTSAGGLPQNNIATVRRAQATRACCVSAFVTLASRPCAVACSAKQQLFYQSLLTFGRLGCACIDPDSCKKIFVLHRIV